MIEWKYIAHLIRSTIVIGSSNKHAIYLFSNLYRYIFTNHNTFAFMLKIKRYDIKAFALIITRPISSFCIMHWTVWQRSAHSITANWLNLPNCCQIMQTARLTTLSICAQSIPQNFKEWNDLCALIINLFNNSRIK